MKKLKAILDQLGGESLYEDSKAETLRKIVEAHGGTPIGFDPSSLARQWLVALGGPDLYEGFEQTLRRILVAYGGDEGYLGGDRLLDAILEVAAVGERLAAPANLEVLVTDTNFDGTFDSVGDADHYEWRLDGAGAWATIVSTSFSGSGDPGDHFVQVRAIDGDGVAGHIATDSFTLTESQFHYLRPGGTDTYLRPGGTDTYVRP